jgi:vitamin B12/bleomycin/antimicrobial peptide transport system ATP-binding/permease protein
MDAPVAPNQVEQSQLRSLTQRFWHTAHGFWTGDQRRVAWILTGSLIALIVLQTFIAYQLNVWNRNLFDAMEKKDGAVVLRQAIVFVPLAVAGILVAVSIVYVRMRLQRRWRAWLTEALGDRWLNKGRYYQLNFIGGDHANPEYRLAEDMRVATEAPVDLATGVLTAFLTAATFIGVLWVVGGAITVDLSGREIYIPGYLVIAVVLYCVIISTSMTFIARSFIPAAEAKNQAEAEFRYALTRLRENGESIAILGGETEERAGLAKLLAAVINAWARMAGQYMRTMAVSHGNFVIASVIPVILCAPKYLAGSMSLGEVMQAAAAFIQVQYAFNWIVDNYPKIAEWTASARRVSGLMVSLDHLDKLEQDGTISAIKRLEADGAAISLRNLSVALSTGKVVVDDVDVNVDLGERVLLAGESGSGKSTLVRAIAGLWPWGEGEIITRPGTHLFLMPQKPYLPLGTLRRAASYPMPAEEVDDEALRQALADVGLEHLVDRLDEEGVKWSDVLSGGEQQRLGLVRLLLHKPDIAIMDESTSALDPEGQAKMFERLGERLPKTAVISVGHRLELEAFHDRKLKLVRQEGGATLVPGDALGPPVSLMTLMMKRWRGPRDRKVADAAA